jgi:protease IV
MTDTKSRSGLGRFIQRTLVVIGAITVGALLLLVLVTITLFRGEGVPRAMILELDLDRGLIETVPEDPFGALIRRDALSVRDAVESLRRAETDDRVRAVVARVGSGALGMAQVDELRAAVVSFRATGKPAILFAETFGDAGPGRSDYYLATVFDEVHLQPSGDVGLAGLLVEIPFLAGTLDLIGLRPQMGQRYEYKDGLNIFTEEEMTEPQREATLRVVTSWYEQIVAGIASGRGLEPDVVRRLIDEGPYTGEEAVHAGLVDRLSYRDEVYDSLRSRVGGGEFLFAEKYLNRAGRPHTRGPTIALIYGTGAVQRGESQINPLVAGATMGSETVTRAFREAIESDAVRAIVFRVDSPGGSYVASDAIWRETLRAREAGKPVIVSMGDVAGSGGYFVAMGADRIVAHPSTITGSIGVYGGKMVIDEISEKLGVTWDDVRVGGNATIWSVVEEFSAEEWERVDTGLDRVYDDFVAKVSDGRGISRDSVHEIARGRIWTGADAHRIGLVDELGGFDVALALARELAGLAPDAPVTFSVFPRERSFVEMLLEPRPNSSYPAGIVGLAALPPAVRQLIHQVGQAGTFAPHGSLSMPFVPRVR